MYTGQGFKQLVGIKRLRIKVSPYLVFTDYRLQISDYKSPITEYRLHITDYCLLINEFIEYYY
jgi:hypothetical protein